MGERQRVHRIVREAKPRLVERLALAVGPAEDGVG
jgi:hypothetical protein